MADRLITIAKYYDYFEASMAKQVLEENGIVAVIMGENLANAVGVAPALANVELQINERDMDAAVGILKDFEENPPDIINPYEDGFDETEDEQ
jgi:hypothetical protein